MPNLRLAVVPGHPGVQSNEVLRQNVLQNTLDQVIAGLLNPVAIIEDKSGVEPEPRGIIIRGSMEEVNEYFHEHELSDSLPIIPPTVEKVKEFLRFTDRSPDDVLGVLLPDNRAASVWSVAVNGVMAGCKAEYMPVLVALIEAMADPYYGVEHSGNTPGADTLILINGPIIKELGFNYTQGVMRDGFRANTTIGRFWRLYLRNIAGFLPHRNDKATFGNTWRVVVAENEDVLKKIGWDPISVEMGFNADANVVTISRFTGGNLISGVSGSVPEAMMPYLADSMVKQHPWQFGFTTEEMAGTLRPLLLLSPILAETIAAGGWSKYDVKRALFDQARMPARHIEIAQRDWRYKRSWDLAQSVRLGKLPKVFYESDDPERMVPLVWEATDYMVAVTGDLGRNSAYMFSHNGALGYPTAREIHLPKAWSQLRKEGASHT